MIAVALLVVAAAATLLSLVARVQAEALDSALGWLLPADAHDAFPTDDEE